MIDTHPQVESRAGLSQHTPRVCVAAENLGLPLDEGGRKFAMHLLQALGRVGPALGISVGQPADLSNVQAVDSNKLFLSPGLRTKVRAFAPHVLCYVPTASDTVFSFLRLWLLARACGKPTTVLVALQPRPHGLPGRWLQRLLVPDLVLVQSTKRATRLAHLGGAMGWLPSGVDLERFRPVSQETKAALRAKYQLPQNTPVVLHVGHITPHRNTDALVELQNQRQVQVVMVTGNSGGEDPWLRQQLERSGVLVIDQYLEAVEEVYQAADCYLFPVTSQGGSIEVPLSILEAMACNLPVVSTPFGGLADMFPSSDAPEAGLLLARQPEDLPGLVYRSLGVGQPRTRELVAPYSWDRVAASLLEAASGVARRRGE